MPSRREIEAAIAAHNNDEREKLLLPPTAALLLAVMFPTGDVCQRSLAYLMAATNDRRRVVERLLRLLVEAGFLSKEASLGRVANLYRLHLPPQAQP